MNISFRSTIFLVAMAAQAAALEFDPPLLGARISDDFGPRIQVPTDGGMRATSPHPGIDFAAAIGTTFHSIEPSKITALDYNGGSGWFIEATSIANSSRTWRYQHLFRKVKISPKSKIFRVIPGSGLFRIFKTVPNPTIVIYSDIEKTNPVKAFTIRTPGDNLGDTFRAPAVGLETREVPLTDIIGAQGRERIGPVGQTGSANGPHLHLQLKENGRKLNPFLHLSHELSSFTITPIYPGKNARFAEDLLPGGILPEPIVFNINSMQGLDLNRVEISIVNPAGTENLLGGFDYQGGQSSTSYAASATLQVVPLAAPPFRPAGKDQFRLQDAKLFSSTAPAGAYNLKIKAFNIHGVVTQEVVPFTVVEPIQGASIQIDSGTSTASYDPSSGRFLSQVYYTATSASGIRAHQLYTFAPNSSFSQISATQTIVAGVASDLPNGDYAIVVFDNEDVATRLDFSLSTMTDSLSSYLSQIHTTTGTYERANVFVTTSPTFDLPGYITGGNFLPIPPLVSVSLPENFSSMKQYSI